MMRKRWIVWLMIIVALSSSVGFAGQREPEAVEYELDGRMELIRTLQDGPGSGCHFGGVGFLSNGNFAAAISEGNQVHLIEYNEEGAVVQETIGGSTEYCGGPIFFVQTSNGDLYTTDGTDLLKRSHVENTFMNLGDTPVWSACFSVRDDEIGIQPMWYRGMKAIFINYEDSLEGSDFSELAQAVILDFDVQEVMPEGYVLDEFVGFYHGESKNIVYLLVRVDGDYYVLETRKTIRTEGDTRQIDLERVSWTQLDVPEGMRITADATQHQIFVATNHGFEIAFSTTHSRISSLVQFNFDGKVIDQVLIPGEIYFFDAKGDQSVIVTWHSPEYSNALYLMNWGTKASGTPKRLIAERTVKGKTVARFRDSGYGLLKTEDEESGAVDYLAPLKTEANDVRLQVPLNDLLARQGDTARDLVILYGEDRIRIPMTQLDCTELLASMPCQDDATVEIRLLRMEDGSVSVKVELFVVEQLDSKTKCVHRTAIDM